MTDRLGIPSQILAEAKAASATLWPVLVAIARYESDFNEKALGDWKLQWGGPIVGSQTPGAFPTSFGLLQFHVDGGLGAGHDVGRLLEAGYNLKLGAEYIQGRLDGGATLHEALQPWSVREDALALLPRIVAELGGLDDEDKGTILGSIDTLWGLSVRLDQEAESLHDQAQAIRDYVIIIKKAAGLEE